MNNQPSSNLITITYIIYGLHLFSAVNGLISSALIVTSFLSGWPSILAVVLNYLKVRDVRGTYLESHFRWQIRTFWFALLWLVVCVLFAVTLIGVPLALLIGVLVGLWILYRMVRGTLTLLDDRPMEF